MSSEFLELTNWLNSKCYVRKSAVVALEDYDEELTRVYTEGYIFKTKEPVAQVLEKLHEKHNASE